MAALKVVCTLVLCMLVAEPMATTAITCGVVASRLAPCVNYLQNGATLPRNCCDGVRALNNQARTTSDRQTVCRCLQDAANNINGLKTQLAEGLPGKCGVNIPYKISKSTNCNNVK